MLYIVVIKTTVINPLHDTNRLTGNEFQIYLDLFPYVKVFHLVCPYKSLENTQLC